MSAPLAGERAALLARLSVPRIRSDRVRRERLFSRLERGAAGRMICVEAPVGFGKTTLLADWIAASRRPCAWVCLDRDQGPDFFLACLEAAVGLALGLDELRAAGDDPESVLLGISSAIADSGRSLVVVLDDFHHARGPEIRDLASRFAEILPAGSCLVVAGRKALPFPASKYRARGELEEIGAEELRFTVPEAREFLARAAPTPLLDEEVALLGAKTEGWIAGIQLAALALRDGRDVKSFIEAFGGTTRSVADFLAEEAISALQPETLELLTALSVVDGFCAPLCEALTGRKDAAEALGAIEKECLFLSPLGDSRNCYRLHVLFREALLARMRASAPGRERELRLAASAWLEANGHPADALRQAALAGDVRRAAALAEGNAIAALERGDVREIRAALEALPEPAAGAGPWLGIAAGWAAAYSGDLAAARSRAAAAEAAAPEAAAAIAAARSGERPSATRDEAASRDGWGGVFARLPRHDMEAPYAESRRTSGPGSLAEGFPDLEAIKSAALDISARTSAEGLRLAGQIEALRAYAHWLAADSMAAVRSSARALLFLPERDIMARCHAELSFAQGCYIGGVDREAREAFRCAMRDAETGRLGHVRCLAAAGLAAQRLALGDIDGARSLCLETVSDRSLEGLPALGEVLVVLSQAYWERNEIAAALDAARRGLDLSLRWGHADSLVSAYITLSMALAAAGDAPAALSLLGNAKRLESVSAWHKLNLEEAAASIELERGNVRGAEGFCTRPQPIRTFEGGFTLAAYLVARRRAAEALPYLQFCRERSTLRGLPTRLAETHILLALVRKSRGERTEAEAELERALAVAAPSDAVRRFVRRGTAILDLLDALLARRRDSFAERVAAAVRASLAQADDRRQESLSPREREILRLMAEGRTAEEAAELLCVAPSTVRSHVKAAYSKLGAHRKIDALNRARELGIL